MARYICTTCKDTHRMELMDRMVPCTFCPVPCDRCRINGTGAYCSVMPCKCACHMRGHPFLAEVSREKLIENLLDASVCSVEFLDDTRPGGYAQREELKSAIHALKAFDESQRKMRETSQKRRR